MFVAALLAPFADAVRAPVAAEGGVAEVDGGVGGLAGGCGSGDAGGGWWEGGSVCIS